MAFNKYCLLASASGVALAGGAAHAADLSFKSPVPVAAPASWAGWYVGINGGVITAQTTIRDVNNWADEGYIASNTLKAMGGMVGGQVGYNWQEDAFVYGLEADIDWVGANSTLSGTLCSCGGGSKSAYSETTQMNWLSTIRGRAGITVGTTQSTLLYVTGGLALGGVKSNWGAGYNTGAVTPANALNPNSFVSNNVKVGWTAGLGIEHMFAGAPQWSFRAEALLVQFANDNVTVPGPSTFQGRPGPYTSQFQNEAVLARLGVNYKF